MSGAWLAVLLASAAQGLELRHSGYLKNLYRHTRSPSTGQAAWLDLTRARLELEGSAAAGPVALTVRAEYDHELRAGSFLRRPEFRALGLAEPPSTLAMQQTISGGSDAHYRHALYRGWVEAAYGDTRLRFGRQRIAWGTGKLWNPTDFLNPYVPTAVERDQRAGVDALHARRALGELGQAEAAYALARDWAGTDLLARGRGNLGGLDASLLAGKLAGSTGSWTAGGDFAVDVAGGGLHGEAVLADPETAAAFWRGLIGYEYTFSAAAPAGFADLWALVELYRNGQGTARPARYDYSRLLGGRAVSVGRDYLGLGLKKELHPLLSAELYQISNLNDGSFFIAPSLDWNALPDLHLAAGWQRFGGRPGSEYGRLPNVLFLQGQYFF